MSDAKRCDVCGTYFDPRENVVFENPFKLSHYAEGIYPTIKIRQLHIRVPSNGISYGGEVMLDICPYCAEAIVKALKERPDMS